jgi:hypothetical protein
MDDLVQVVVLKLRLGDAPTGFTADLAADRVIHDPIALVDCATTGALARVLGCDPTRVAGIVASIAHGKFL